MIKLEGNKINGFNSLEELREHLSILIDNLKSMEFYYDTYVKSQDESEVHDLLGDLQEDLKSLELIKCVDGIYKFKTGREQIEELASKLSNKDLSRNQFYDICIQIENLHKHKDDESDYDWYTKLERGNFYS